MKDTSHFVSLFAKQNQKLFDKREIANALKSLQHKQNKIKTRSPYKEFYKPDLLGNIL